MPTKVERDLAIQRDVDRRRELRRCQTDLWYLATEYLGYRWNPEARKRGVFKGKGLTERLHLPVCDWFDSHANDPFVGLWLQRWGHKTTLVVCKIVQDILVDPWVSLFYFHAVDKLAQGVVAEVGNHLKSNEKLRSLDPIATLKDGTPWRAFPTKRQRLWLKTEEFTVNRPQEAYSRHPTLWGKGAGSEVTGHHANKAYLDDVIGRKTVDDNQLPKIKDWFENTVVPVVDDMQFVVTGTPWSDWGLYSDWQADEEWRTLIIPGAPMETLADVDWSQDKIHLTPDYELAHPVYGPPEIEDDVRKLLLILKRQMKSNFGPQIMCDPSPAEERKWSMGYERYCGVEETTDAPGASMPGVVVTLSDPAPAKEGSMTNEGEKKRSDGTKDDWSVCTWKFALWRAKQIAILLEIRGSKEWERSDGCMEAARQMRKWGTNLFFNEWYGMGGADYTRDMKKAVERNGNERGLYLSVHGGVKQLPRFDDSYVKHAKNRRFSNFADWAQQGCVFFCAETCDRAELDKLLAQLRQWRVLTGGGNSLKFDDYGDIASRVTDSALQRFAPQEGFGVREAGIDPRFNQHFARRNSPFGRRNVQQRKSLVRGWMM